MMTNSISLERKAARCNELSVWDMAQELTSQIYHVTNFYPEKEQFRLTSQMRSAALSLPGNIVEGKSKKSHKEFQHFLSIARGTVNKLNYFFVLSKSLNYINGDQYEELEDKRAHIGSMLYDLMKINKPSLN